MTEKTTTTEKTKAKATQTPKAQTGQWPGDVSAFVRQSLEYNRKGIESVFNAVESFQGKAEEYTGKALEQSAYIPEEGKAQVKRWIEAGKKARNGFREAVIKGHERFEKWVTAA